MTARGATSSDSASVGATANANAALMTHYVSVDQLASNVYLIGTKTERENESVADKNLLSSVLFDKIENGSDGKIKTTFNGTTTEYNESDTAIFFSLTDGVNELLTSKSPSAVIASASPDAATGTYIVNITKLAEAATADVISINQGEAIADNFKTWTGNVFSDTAELKNYFKDLGTDSATSDTTAIEFTVGDGKDSVTIGYTYAELNAFVSNGKTWDNFVTNLNSKISAANDTVNVEAYFNGDNIAFKNTSNATGEDSKVIISFNQTKLDNAISARTDTFITDVNSTYDTTSTTAINTASETATGTANKNATKAAYQSAYADYKAVIDNIGSDNNNKPDANTVIHSATAKALAEYKTVAYNAVGGSNPDKAAKRAAIKAAYNYYYDSSTGNTNSTTAYSQAFTDSYNSYKTSASGTGATSAQKAMEAAYTSYNSNQDSATAYSQAFNASYNKDKAIAQNGKSDNEKTAINDAYDDYRTMIETAGKTEADAKAYAYSAYKTAAKNATTDSATQDAIEAAYTTYNGSNLTDAKNAAYSQYQTAVNGNAALQAAYDTYNTNNGNFNSNTAKNAAYDTYSTTVNSSGDDALQAAYNVYDTENGTFDTTAATKAAYDTYKTDAIAAETNVYIKAAISAAYDSFKTDQNATGDTYTTAYNAVISEYKRSSEYIIAYNNALNEFNDGASGYPPTFGGYTDAASYADAKEAASV